MLLFVSHCDPCVESIDKLLRSLICGNGGVMDIVIFFLSEIDGTVELVLSVGVTEINAAIDVRKSCC